MTNVNNAPPSNRTQHPSTNRRVGIESNRPSEEIECIICLKKIDDTTDTASFNCKFPEHVLHSSCMSEYITNGYSGCMLCNAGRIRPSARIEPRNQAQVRAVLRNLNQNLELRHIAWVRARNNITIKKVNTALLMSLFTIAIPHCISMNRHLPDELKGWPLPTLWTLFGATTALQITLLAKVMESCDIESPIIERTLKGISSTMAGITATATLGPPLCKNLPQMSSANTSAAIAGIVVGASIVGANLPILFYKCLRRR